MFLSILKKTGTPTACGPRDAPSMTAQLLLDFGGLNGADDFSFGQQLCVISVKHTGRSDTTIVDLLTF